MYEAEYIDNQNFQSICSLGQPFIMSLNIVCIYKIDKDAYLYVKDACDNEVVSISYGSLENLIDEEKQYYSEKNNDFGLDSSIQKLKMIESMDFVPRT